MSLSRDLQSAVSKPTVPSVPTYFLIPNPFHQPFLHMENQQKLPPELLFLTLMCTKSFVGWGLTPEPDPTGELTALPQTP